MGRKREKGEKSWNSLDFKYIKRKKRGGGMGVKPRTTRHESLGTRKKRRIF